MHKDNSLGARLALVMYIMLGAFCKFVQSLRSLIHSGVGLVSRARLHSLEVKSGPRD